MRIAVSRRLWSIALAALFAHCTSSGARADLTILIRPHGATQTSWSFFGSSTAALDGTIRATGSVVPDIVDAGDTWEMDGEPIINSTISDMLYTPASGNATITVGGTTRAITQVFLDHDLPTDSNGPPHDFGIRADAALSYMDNDTTSWTGSLILPIAIDDLRFGSYTSVFNAPNFSSGAGSLNIHIVPVPEPSSMAMIGLAGLFGGVARYRRRRKTPEGEAAAA